MLGRKLQIGLDRCFLKRLQPTAEVLVDGGARTRRACAVLVLAGKQPRRQRRIGEQTDILVMGDSSAMIEIDRLR
jgi:hypothetical protein